MPVCCGSNILLNVITNFVLQVTRFIVKSFCWRRIRRVLTSYENNVKLVDVMRERIFRTRKKDERTFRTKRYRTTYRTICSPVLSDYTAFVCRQSVAIIRRSNVLGPNDLSVIN